MTNKEFAHAEVIESDLTTQESRAKYEIIYAYYSRTFFSYRCKTYDYVGGLHGFAGVIIGTVDVATGQELTLDDVIPPDKRAEALTRLKNAVVKKIGADNLQGRSTLPTTSA